MNKKEEKFPRTKLHRGNIIEIKTAFVHFEPNGMLNRSRCIDYYLYFVWTNNTGMKLGLNGFLYNTHVFAFRQSHRYCLLLYFTLLCLPRSRGRHTVWNMHGPFVRFFKLAKLNICSLFFFSFLTVAFPIPFRKWTIDLVVQHITVLPDQCRTVHLLYSKTEKLL